jgi:hypothetical protein
VGDRFVACCFICYELFTRAFIGVCIQERTAANHRQYEVAMATMEATVTKFRRVIQDAIKRATMTPVGNFVAFTPCLPHHDLVKLAPVLKTEVYIDLLACSTRLTADAFDPAYTATYQQGFAGNTAGTKTDRDRGEATQNRQLQKTHA